MIVRICLLTSEREASSRCAGPDPEWTAASEKIIEIMLTNYHCGFFKVRISIWRNENSQSPWK